MSFLAIFSLIGKKVLTSPATWIILGVVAIFLAGAMYGKSCEQNKEQKQVVKEVIKYVRDKEAIAHKYSGNTFTDGCILSGCIPDAAISKACQDCKRVH